MVDVIQRLILEAETGDAQRELDDVRKSQARLADEIKKAGRDTDKTKNETRELVDQYKALVDRERALEQQIRETTDAYGDRRQVLEANERFDRTSRGVALAGDVESNLRTIGGAAGAFGLGGVERAIGIGAEIPAVIEALPRLKEAAAGLPAAFGQAASSLGTSTLALGGLIAATAAFTIVLQAAQQAQEARTEFARQSTDAALNANNIQRASTEDLLSSVSKLNETITDGSQDLETARGVLSAFEQSLQENGLLPFAELGNAIGVSGTELGVLRGTIDDLNTSTITAQTNLNNSVEELRKRGVSEEDIQAALNQTSLSASEAAAAEQQLAMERMRISQGVLADAQNAGALATLRERVTNLTKEQIAAELDSLRLRETGLKAELDTLRQSGDESEQVASKIRQLTDTLENLGDQMSILESASSSAKSAIQETVNTTQQAAQPSAFTTGTQPRTRGARISSRAAVRTSKPTTTRNQLLKQDDDYLERLSDLRNDAYEEDERALRRATFDRQRIIDDALDNENDAAKERNFAALAETRQARDKDLRDLRDQYRFEQDERRIALRNQERELNRSYDTQLRLLQNTKQQELRINQQAYQAQLSLASGFAQRMTQITNRASNVASSQSFDEMTYALGGT